MTTAQKVGTPRGIRLVSPLPALSAGDVDYLPVDRMQSLPLDQLARHVCVLYTFTAEIRQHRLKLAHIKYLASAGEIVSRRLLQGELL